VAVVLVREARGLLIGEGVAPRTRHEIRELAKAMPGVVDVGEILSMYVGRHEVLVTLQLSFAPEVSTQDAAAALLGLEGEVQRRYPMVRRLYLAFPRAR
jgi:divalent metal cation (Fe/Co/Zn/Cd) transporter